ncbi:tail associated lysin [Bacillus phage vB_BmeM-Goe8]|uniref:DNA transfer protein n=1 Tax=Bacillus phage vB_BmeM-Goe8 TaxID=2593638 RepID=A0A516KMP2_9CAUD|nr:tail associated lysin [Bacillus phage vB_BmeM-Goe8]QDP42862.1 DNA transfer protein [Bacillus phage vB_BmeM-Goe8]
MAKEEFIFDVDAETSKAVSKLEKIERLMNKLNSVHIKGVDNYSTTNQKDMDKNMRSMRQLTKLYSEMNRDLTNLQAKMRKMSDGLEVPTGATQEQREEIEKLKQSIVDQTETAIKQQKKLSREYDHSLAAYREFATFQQNYSKNFKSAINSKDIFNLPSGAESFGEARKTMQSLANEAEHAASKISQVTDKIQEVNKLDRRADSLSRRGAASKYMSYQQAQSFSKDYRTSSQDYVAQREENMNAMTRIGQERRTLHEQVTAIQQNPEATNQDIDKKIAYQQSIESMDKEMDARLELNRVLNRTIKNMEGYNDRLSNGNVEVKPERGTLSGMMYERAPAIGFAASGAFAGVFGSLYGQGASLNKGIRDDVISIGQHTGMEGEQWREGIRDNALDAGLSDKLGYGGADMLAFQQNYLSNNGFEGMDDLNSAMKNQAVFSRSTGVDSATTKDFFGSMYNTGAVSGIQSKDIQDAFIGAIKQSGMEGREKDQLKALQGLVASNARGRTMTNDEVMNVMGLQSVLANSGERSLQGEQGGQLLSQLDEGIKGGFQDPMVRLVFGQGTKYQGLEGRAALRKQMDKGIADPENVENIAKYAESQSNTKAGQNEVFATFSQEKLSTDITGEQAEKIMDMYRRGELSKESIDKVMKENKDTGKAEGDKKLANYQNSHEAIDNQSESTTEKQATQLYDFGEALRVTNSALGGLNPALYASIIAVGAFTAALAASTLSLGGSSLLRGLAGKKFGGRGGGGPKGGGGGPKGGGGGGVPPIVDARGNPIQSERKGFFGRTKDTIGGWFGRNGTETPNVPKGPTPEGAPKSGFFASVKEKAGGFFGAAKEKTGGFFNAAKEKVGGWFSKGGGGGTSGAVEGAASGGLKGFLGKGGKILGKAALPLSLAIGAGEILSAEKGKKAEAIGSVGGGILGGMGGGAAAGAALGSVVPGLGTVIGGIGGSIVGGIAGSSLGGWIGSKFNSEPTKAEAATIDESQTKEKAKKEEKGNVKDQLERENTNTKDRAENKRLSNIGQERENLKLYETLLNRAEQILAQARSQNGIFGNGNGMSGGDGSGGTGAATPVTGNSNSEKAWNFFASKGMSEGAIAGIMGNLQQESQIDPTAPNGGLAQWLGPRRKDLNNYAKQTGGDVNSMETQLNFLWKELESGQYGSIDELNKLNPTEAAKYFEKHYEKAGKPMMEKRIGYANDWYNQYGNGKSPQAKTNSGTSSVNSSSNTNSSVKVNSNINVNVKGDEKTSEKLKSNKELQSIADSVQQKIYGAMGFHAIETRRA